jgi:squalene-hopene/tetraprenyl-beta-curcumene cyclase
MLQRDRVRRAYETARSALLAERTRDGHWVGELSSSPLSTATACSALAIASRFAYYEVRENYRQAIRTGLSWVLQHQNPDGGWGDTDRSLSNIATTMLVRAALHLAERTEAAADALERAEQYLQAQGDIAGLRRRYGKDKTFAVPILTNCALAGLVSWKEVSPLPFELACLPQSWYRFARMPVVSYAVPALVAIGQARHHFAPSWNPAIRYLRDQSIERSLRVLHEMQPESGGYLEATPLTSFVVMSLASIGLHDHPVTRSGLRFLIDSIRGDGSWPIDTNLATWVTSLSINALGTRDGTEHLTPKLLDWLLSCQHRVRHRFTGADPGGWGWSDLSGAVPDADDTPGALIAVERFPAEVRGTSSQGRHAGTTWLLGLQNGNGGWPTFCRGWGKLPFDRSGTDLTAHAVRALNRDADSGMTDPWGTPTSADVDSAIERGFRYLSKQQRPDGSWLPLWFGNQHRPDDENPLYGTARVLLAYRDLNRLGDEPALRGLAYLASQQNADGGWGGDGTTSSVEETAVVVEALAADFQRPETRTAVERGVSWLVEAVETGRFRHASPIGFYFAKLWYYEKLYPLIFTVGALRTVLETLDRSESHT